jgi:hypothetical protein
VLPSVDTLSEWSLHFVSICRDILSKSVFSIFSNTISGICVYLQPGSYMLLHPWRSSFESRDEILLRGGKVVTPQVSISCYVGRFIIISDAKWKFLFLAHVCLWLSRLFVHIWPNSELFSLTEGQIWGLLKLLFSAQMQTRKSFLNYKSHLKHLIKLSTTVIWSEPESNSSNFDLCSTILIQVRTLKRNIQYVVLKSILSDSAKYLMSEPNWKPTPAAILKCHDSPSPTRNPKADRISTWFIFESCARSYFREKSNQTLDRVNRPIFQNLFALFSIDILCQG